MPVTDAPIKKVWIEAGCISCKLCQDIAPKVFLGEDDQDCVNHPDAAKYFAAQREDVEQAMRDCPVEVIKIEHAWRVASRRPGHGLCTRSAGRIFVTPR